MQLQTPIADLDLRQIQPHEADALYRLIQANRAHLTQRGDYSDLVEVPRAEIVKQLSSPDPSTQQFGVYLAGVLIGTVALIQYQPTIYGLGYWISADHAGCGYMTESVGAIVGYAISECGASEIWAGITPSNAPSIRLVERLGFELARTQETHLSYRLDTSGAPLLDG